MAILLQVDHLEYEEPDRSRAQPDPWLVPVAMTERGTLDDVLRLEFVSILAAHVLAYAPGARITDPVRWETFYTGPNAFRRGIRDLEHNGIVYREYCGRIHKRRARCTHTSTT